MRLKFFYHALAGVVLAALLHGCSSTPSSQAPTPVVEQGRPASAQQSSSYRSSGHMPAKKQADAMAVSVQPPAVVTLLRQAEQQANAGDLESAAATLERAIRIDPHNAVIWHHLATVRLSQGEPMQAEQLATKSNSLAPGNYAQQSRNWLLIAQARRQMNNSPGAAVAEQRARELSDQ